MDQSLLRKLEQLIGELGQKGVELNSLFVFYAGQDTIIGHLQETAEADSTIVEVLNPIRLLIMRQVTERGLGVGYNLIDFEFGDTHIDIRPHAVVEIALQSVKMQIAFAEMYLKYLDALIARSAAAVGIVAPGR